MASTQSSSKWKPTLSAVQLTRKLPLQRPHPFRQRPRNRPSHRRHQLFPRRIIPRLDHWQDSQLRHTRRNRGASLAHHFPRPPDRHRQHWRPRLHRQKKRPLLERLQPSVRRPRPFRIHNQVQPRISSAFAAAFTLALAASRLWPRSTGTNSAIFIARPITGISVICFFSSTEHRPGIVVISIGGSMFDTWFETIMHARPAGNSQAPSPPPKARPPAAPPA